MNSKIISMTEFLNGNCQVVVETPIGEMLTLGFSSPWPTRDEEHYSKVICFLIDKYYQEKQNEDLYMYLFRNMAICYMESPLFIQKDKNEERVRIGKRITEIRESLGLTLAQLASRCGIEVANLHRIEQGRYSAGFDILTKIASALNCRIDFVTNKD